MKTDHFFAFTRKDRCGIYVLLFFIGATIVLRTVYPFWKTDKREFSAADTAEAIAAGKAAFSGGAGWTSGRGGYKDNVVYGEQYAGGSSQQTNGNYTDKSHNDSSAAQAQSASAAQRKPYGNIQPYSSNYTPPAYMQKKQFVATLNSADTNDLKELRGIGSGFARRIVAYREKLGGFVRKEQLKEVWGIDSALYSKIAQQVTIDASKIRKININTATIDILKKHPYLDYYLAKEIVKYREKHGTFTTIDDLQKVNLIDSGTYNRIKPYLTVEL
ncbi:MAG: ComEA family DNA-binding protein [Bacteroidales bacterium]|jgi:competence ComEA-like helix-hairpin-helix protein|nr:ComEA family DNA-binding protein [Bacteroidales bacterium]